MKRTSSQIPLHIPPTAGLKICLWSARVWRSLGCKLKSAKSGLSVASRSCTRIALFNPIIISCNYPRYITIILARLFATDISNVHIALYNQKWILESLNTGKWKKPTLNSQKPTRNNEEIPQRIWYPLSNGAALQISPRGRRSSGHLVALCWCNGWRWQQVFTGLYGFFDLQGTCEPLQFAEVDCSWPFKMQTLQKWCKRTVEWSETGFLWRSMKLVRRLKFIPLDSWTLGTHL